METEAAPNTCHKRSYVAATISSDVKDLIGDFYNGLKTAKVKLAQFRILLDLAGLGGLGNSTIREWASRRKKGLPAIKTDKLTGKAPSLTEEEEQLVVGFVLAKSQARTPVGISEIQEFCVVELKVKGPTPSPSTVSRMMKRNGFSCKESTQSSRKKKASYKVDYLQMTLDVYDWLSELHKSELLLKKPWDIVSIDWTYCKQGGVSRKEYVPSGTCVFFSSSLIEL